MAYKKVQVSIKITKKSGPLIIRVKGLDSSSSSSYYYSYFSSIYINNIRDSPLYIKKS